MIFNFTPYFHCFAGRLEEKESPMFAKTGHNIIPLCYTNSFNSRNNLYGNIVSGGWFVVPHFVYKVSFSCISRESQKSHQTADLLHHLLMQALCEVMLWL